jgi:hypothetical protein
LEVRPLSGVVNRIRNLRHQSGDFEEFPALGLKPSSEAGLRIDQPAFLV